MSQGRWGDFTNKFGFGDGEKEEDRDYFAREFLIEMLNRESALKKNGIRAVEYDRPGVHNGCMILLLPAEEGKSDEEQVKRWESGEIEEKSLPESFEEEFEMDEKIGWAYWLADKKMAREILRGNSEQPVLSPFTSG